MTKNELAVAEEAWQERHRRRPADVTKHVTQIT